MEPTAVIGVPVHNGERHVRQALRSLLDQTYEHCAVVVLDDASTDGSPGLVAETIGDATVHVARSETALGLVGAWRRVFDLALELHPDARYFAWGSDHDVWEPDWMSRLVDALEAHPEAVFAWPELDAVDEEGAPFERKFRNFDTRGVADPVERIRAFAQTKRAGDMVYGLYRVAAMQRCGPFPFILQPDRLFLARLSLEGEFVQVPQVLWHRRYRRDVVASMSRQRRSLWGGEPPLWTFVPWRVQHWVWLVGRLRRYSFPHRLRIATTYAVAARWVTASKPKKDRMRRRRRRRERWRHRLGRLRR